MFRVGSAEEALRVSPENASMDGGLVRRLFAVSLPGGHCLIQHFAKLKQKSVEFHGVALDCDLDGQGHQAFSLFLGHRDLRPPANHIYHKS